jgi:para-nitrobenzyl esterase
MSLAGDVLSAHTLFENNGHGGEWGAVVDGKVVSQQPSEVGVRVPSIFGSNTNEATLFLFSAYGAAVATLNASVYDEFLEWNFGPVASLVNKTYGLDKFSKSPAPVFAAMSTVITEYKYHCPASRALRTAVSNKIPVWGYNFAHTPSCAWYQGIPTDPKSLQMFGPTHTAEIPFIFGLTSQLPPPGGNCSFSISENSISDFMLGTWTSMAAAGKPASSGAWPSYSPDKSLGLIVKDTAAAGSLDFTACEFWDKVNAAVMEAAVNATRGAGGIGSQSAGAVLLPTTGKAVRAVVLSAMIMLML